MKITTQSDWNEVERRAREFEASKPEKVTLCHHCGQRIVFNRTWPDAKNSHWAHAILVFNGRARSIGNALMEQRCKDGIHWATPKREFKYLVVTDGKTTREPIAVLKDGYQGGDETTVFPEQI